MSFDRKFCKICGVDISKKDNVPYIDESGQGDICMLCNDSLYKTKYVDAVNISQPVIFKSKVTKLGRGRKHIEIPKKQRDFLAYDKDYIVIIKNMEAEKQ